MGNDHGYVRRPFPIDHKDEDPGEKFRYLLLPPELSDGASSEVLLIEEADDGHFRALFETWQNQVDPGDTVEIGFVEMTEADFKALPEM